MDDLTACFCKQLLLTPKKESPIVPPPKDYSLYLIGRIVMDRELSDRSLKLNVLHLLQPVKGAEFLHISSNTFMLRFSHPLDRKIAMEEGCPWIIQKHALIFCARDPLIRIHNHVVNEMKIVVRIHDLPLAYRSVSTAKLIGDNLGQFVEIPKSSSSALYLPYSYFRIKILVDVTKPLRRGFFLEDATTSKVIKKWYQVSYERLPYFCFLCGILGHWEKKCPKRYEDDFVEEPEGELPYGTWLRANSDHTQVRVVPLGHEINRPVVISFGSKTKDSLKENLQPNVAMSVSSGQISVARQKRKGIDSACMDIDMVGNGKKLQLCLMDEEPISKAETDHEH